MSVMSAMGVPPVLERHNGGSDANIFNGRGIRTLNLSIGMENVHSTREYIKTENLVRSLEFLVAFLTDTKGVIRDA
jgi:tripeptide aminopeptidase